MSSKELAAACKAKGNAAFKAQDFKTAIGHYTDAIGHDASQHALYSNRSACYASLREYAKALVDAEKCTDIAPQWHKGYNRKGLALLNLDRAEEAKASYEAGLKIKPGDAGLADGLKSAESALAQASNPMGKMFVNMWGKLQADPTTAGYLQDPGFVQKMNMLQSNPNMLSTFAQSDPQVGAAIGVLLGIGASAFQSMGAGGHGGPGAPGGPNPFGAGPTGPSAAELAARKEAEAAELARKAEEEKKRQEEEEINAMSPEERAEQKQKELEEQAEQKQKALALESKTEGNALYKKKQFDAAIEKYEAASKLDPKNPTFLTNIAAAFHAKKDYDSSIAKCREALELAAQVNWRDFSFKAKAYLRIGNGFLLKKEYENAIDAYDSSLLEDRIDSAVVNKAKAEKRLKKKRELEYLSPELSLEAKTRGNDLYREGKFPQAAAEYSEAIKRDPTNHVFYSNRANCYSKLMSWSAALADCDKCIDLCPTFTKIYIRKGKIQHFLKNYKGAIDAYDKGLALEPTSTELVQAKRLTYMKINEQNSSGTDDKARQREAMKDPEIQRIMQDPSVMNLLRDPVAAQDAMRRDPVMRAKINKLVQAGIVKTN